MSSLEQLPAQPPAQKLAGLAVTAEETGRSQLRLPRTTLTPARQQLGLAMLTPEELPLWDALVEESPQGSVFTRRWWLTATCGEVRVLGYFEPGKLIAGIPLYYERHLGMRICRMPKLTQTMGVVLRPLAGKTVSRKTRETEILTEFAARLAKETVFIQALHPSLDNWLPFYWRGFTETTHYTYVLDDLSSVSRIWDGLDKDRRANIRKARRLGLTVKECEAGVVYRATQASFERQGRKCPYTPEYLERIYQAARAHDAGVCMAAVDSCGRIHAAEFMVWDAKRSYGIAGGHHPALGASCGGTLLRWALIEFAATRTAIFDFEGSMQKTIEASFRSFGTRRVSYFRIVKAPGWLRAGLCLAGRPQL